MNCQLHCIKNQNGKIKRSLWNLIKSYLDLEKHERKDEMDDILSEKGQDVLQAAPIPLSV
jgi:hypothetical protein